VVKDLKKKKREEETRRKKVDERKQKLRRRKRREDWVLYGRSPRMGVRPGTLGGGQEGKTEEKMREMSKKSGVAIAESQQE